MSNREFDLVIFGATGFTGYFVIRELLQSIEQNPEENGKICWAVAGRNLQKLDTVLVKVASELSEMKQLLLNVVKICANVDEPESLAVMARRTRLVINVVGPFGLYGKPVVEACVQAGTDYIDISGEPGFNDQTYLDFNQKALEQKSLIISGCAFDSVPSDCGVQFVKDQFNGRLHSVESYFQFNFSPNYGYRFNVGTFMATITAIRFSLEMFRTNRRLRREVLTKKMPESRRQLSYRIVPFKLPKMDGWNVPFPGPDNGIVERTQYYNYQTHNELPVQFRSYFNIGSLFYLFGIFLLSSIIALFSMFEFTRNLLKKYPKVFTYGLVSNDGPSRRQIDGTTFRMYLLGRGWPEEEEEDDRPEEDNSEPKSEPTKLITALVSGPDPGYIGTSAFVVQCGLTILNDRSRIASGGVLTPGSAFRSTKLLQRLESRNIKFTVLSS